MDQAIEVDNQESAPNDDEPADEDIPTTSSELEHHPGSEQSKCDNFSSHSGVLSHVLTCSEIPRNPSQAA